MGYSFASQVTTDKGKRTCASTHGGTSAAAPNAVGVFVLALEARCALFSPALNFVLILI